MGLFELANLLDLIHEVSAVDVLHDKVQAVLRRDRRVNRERERETGQETLRGQTGRGMDREDLKLLWRKEVVQR